ncbi:coenzyme F420-0:L-glutamate ligase [Rhodopila sp.]|jgi:coenzyme F420-0:L-glutamate ligase|uniref:coenzyme F420-0:L-glutamate ligase n=1 Tax=Rhodopila sp. TaxID=2480087 RepID=UPI002CECA942|nr:coenzyme F420-0:L-glutamate ligase [Rhodopila sp.]HVZ09192.1 coenzyme F420-0:L-glutamate ligase [Rhodopila sp.]
MPASPSDSAVTSLIRVKTRPMLPPRDDLYAVLGDHLPPLREGDVLVITSKIVAIHQGRCVAMASVGDKEELVEAEADAWIPKASSKYGITLAIKGGTLIASAGIDASNSKDHYVLWPDDPSGAAAEIGRWLKQRHGLQRLGVILSDSHCIPLRRGTTGITIGFYGFEALMDYRGTPDIFGRPLAVTLSNRADAMAAAAVGLMGEGAECVPVVIVRDWPDLVFNDQAGQDGFFIPPDEDIFSPLMEGFRTHGRAPSRPRGD